MMIDSVVGWIRAAARVVVLTGAGISAESGVPTFRGAGGLWRQFRAEDLATPEAFARNPQLVWDWYLWRRQRIAAAVPNPGHHAIAAMQMARTGVMLLTQNVDGLHQRAGAEVAAELHGNLWRVRCAARCGVGFEDDHQAPPRTTLKCRCGAWLRPDVVWFGEALDAEALDAAGDAVENAQVVLIVGTSAVVYPVAALPAIARRRRARIVEINVDETPISANADAVLRGPAGEILPALEQAL
jgi:NAD-dependent deacetylase